MSDEKIMQKVDSVCASIRSGLAELQKLALQKKGSEARWIEVEKKLGEIDGEIWDDLIDTIEPEIL